MGIVAAVGTGRFLSDLLLPLFFFEVVSLIYWMKILVKGSASALAAETVFSSTLFDLAR